MAMTRDQIRNAAMSLSPAERQKLAEELLLSVTDEEQDVIDAAWLDEVRRRDEEFTAGQSTSRPVEEILSKLEKRSP